MLQENISEKNGFIRLALGASMTAYGIAHLVKEDSNKSLGSLLVSAGAMKMAEGVFLYCPMKAFMNSNVKDAVNNTFEEFMDGESLMQAFRATFEDKASAGSDTLMGAATKVASAMTESNNQSGSSNEAQMN